MERRAHNDSGELRAGNATNGDGNKATLRFSVVELERWLAGGG